MGLTVSAATTTNTSIELQWSDDTPGITNYKVCYHMFSYSNYSNNAVSSTKDNTMNVVCCFKWYTPLFVAIQLGHLMKAKLPWDKKLFVDTFIWRAVGISVTNKIPNMLLHVVYFDTHLANKCADFSDSHHQTTLSCPKIYIPLKCLRALEVYSNI